MERNNAADRAEGVIRTPIAKIRTAGQAVVFVVKKSRAPFEARLIFH